MLPSPPLHHVKEVPPSPTRPSRQGGASLVRRHRDIQIRRHIKEEVKKEPSSLPCTFGRFGRQASSLRCLWRGKAMKEEEEPSHALANTRELLLHYHGCGDGNTSSRNTMTWARGPRGRPSSAMGSVGPRP